MFQPANLFNASPTGALVHQIGSPSLRRLDVVGIFSVFRRQWALIAATTFLSLLAMAAFVAFVTPQYTATTQILIDPTDLRGIENGVTQSAQISETSVLQVESQVRVLTSDNVLRRVVVSENLSEDPEFASTPGLLARLGLARSAGPIDKVLAALISLGKRVQVRRAERTYVVDVSVSTSDPIKSARIANAVAKAYLEEQTAARSDAARRVSDSLQSRLTELKTRARQSEQRVEDYKAQNNIVGASGLLVNEQQLSELNNQLTLARARASEAKAAFEQVQKVQKAGAEVGALTEALQSQTISVLRSQYADVARHEAEMMTKYGPRHPAVLDIEAQAQGLRRQINDELSRIAQAARNEYERAHSNEEALARNLETLKNKTLATNEAMVAMHELEREAQANRAVYQAFLVRSQETGEQERLDTRNVRIISQAEIPQSRSWPPRTLMLGFGALAFGFAAGTGLAFLREANSSGQVEVPESIPAATSLPLLAVLDDAGAVPDSDAIMDPRSRLGTEVRRLHDALTEREDSSSGHSVLVVAPHGGREATTVALNLAVFAAEARRVLVIDADVRGRTFAAILRGRADAGLVDVAAGRVDLLDAVVYDRQTGISLLPLVSSGSRRNRDIGIKDIRAAFDQSSGFDLVIVTASAGENDLSARLFGNLVDQIVLAVKAGKTRNGDIVNVLASLGDASTKIRGTVLTRPGRRAA
jgi:polysaccharide biosynthesis transport protein